MTSNSESSSPWKTARWHSDLVPISNGSRQISVTVNGQPRTETSSEGQRALVIIAAGLGGVAAEHVVVAQLVAPFARVLRFDRLGCGGSSRSEADETPHTMEQSAKDLTAVLEAIDLDPPYVLVGQSFGGVFNREFLRQRGSKDVVGMVFVDCIPAQRWRDAELTDELISTLCGERGKYEEIDGLIRNMVLTPQQKEDVEHDSKIGEKNGAIEGEAKNADESQILVEKAEGMKRVADEEGHAIEISFSEKPLGEGRMSIIMGDFPRDFESALKYGRAQGFGDEETYRKADKMLERVKKSVPMCQEAQGQLTKGEVRVRRASGTGRTHNLHMTRPDIVAEEVRWVLEQQ